jgi:hypothetical protein
MQTWGLMCAAMCSLTSDEGPARDEERQCVFVRKLDSQFDACCWPRHQEERERERVMAGQESEGRRIRYSALDSKV